MPITARQTGISVLAGVTPSVSASHHCHPFAPAPHHLFPPLSQLPAAAAGEPRVLQQGVPQAARGGGAAAGRAAGAARSRVPALQVRGPGWPGCVGRGTGEWVGWKKGPGARALVRGRALTVTCCRMRARGGTRRAALCAVCTHDHNNTRHRDPTPNPSFAATTCPSSAWTS